MNRRAMTGVLLTLAVVIGGTVGYLAARHAGSYEAIENAPISLAAPPRSTTAPDGTYLALEEPSYVLNRKRNANEVGWAIGGAALALVAFGLGAAARRRPRAPADGGTG
jgi:hypothetical protein